VNLSQLMTQDLILLDLNADTKDSVIETLVAQLDQAGALTDVKAFKQAICAREEQGHTGIGFGVAIPHGKSDAVNSPRVAFARTTSEVVWDEQSGERARLIFMIAVPESHAGNEHLKILQMLAVKLIDDSFRENLLSAGSKEGVFTLLTEEK
jgi:fructose-specific phosphotransferase system IIA component